MILFGRQEDDSFHHYNLQYKTMRLEEHFFSETADTLDVKCLLKNQLVEILMF